MSIYSTLHHILNPFTPPRPTRPQMRVWLPFVGGAVFLALWQVTSMLRLYPEFIIPPPMLVVSKFAEVIADGRLWLHTTTTLTQLLVGLAVGAWFGVLLGYWLAKSRTLEAVLSPVIVAFQSTPVVAYAPLLVIWFGSGAVSKIVICALVVCFPILMNTLIGIRTIQAEQRELMRALGASGRDILLKLEIPASLPVLLGGLKVGATLAVIGSVVGEFVGANAGLGFLINLARSQYDTPLVYVSVITLAIIARILYGAVGWVEARTLRWRRAEQIEALDR